MLGTGPSRIKARRWRLEVVLAHHLARLLVPDLDLSSKKSESIQGSGLQYTMVLVVRTSQMGAKKTDPNIP